MHMTVNIDRYIEDMEQWKKTREENERLQQENNNLKTSLDESQEVVIDLQQRIEKAVEYIKQNAWYMNKDDEEILDRVGIEGLLKILEGDNNE